jgi:hypothetical protein
VLYASYRLALDLFWTTATLLAWCGAYCTAAAMLCWARLRTATSAMVYRLFIRS